MELINQIFSRFWFRFLDYLPQLIGGFIIIGIGLFIIKLIVKFVRLFFKFFHIFDLLKKTKLISEKDLQIWEEVFLEILKWIIFLIFLMTAFEVWGFNKAIILLNQMINFLPNVIISIIIAFFGFIFANLGDKLVSNTISKKYPKKFFGFLTRTIIFFFTGLIILNQLGIAQDIIRILFTGIVGMFTIAGGIAFGLGGKETAKDILDHLKRNIS